MLETAELFWITTVRADGRPHVTPLVAVWLDGAIHFHTGADEQKAVNLRANPHVVLTTGCNRWDEGLDVVVEGEAVRVTDEEMLKRLAEVWATKWDGRWQARVRAPGTGVRAGLAKGPAHAVRRGITQEGAVPGTEVRIGARGERGLEDTAGASAVTGTLIRRGRRR